MFSFHKYSTLSVHSLPRWPGSKLNLELQLGHPVSAPPPLLSGTDTSLLTLVLKAIRTLGQTASTVPGDFFSWGRREEGAVVCIPAGPEISMVTAPCEEPLGSHPKMSLHRFFCSLKDST